MTLIAPELAAQTAGGAAVAAPAQSGTSAPSVPSVTAVVAEKASAPTVTPVPPAPSVGVAPAEKSPSSPQAAASAQPQASTQPPAVQQPAAQSSAVQPPAKAPPKEAAAAPLSARARQVARQRFDRGLELYDAGDYAGALREFQGALEVTRHPVVLYNVAIVYAQLGSPVECVRSVEELQQGGINVLDASSREHLHQIYEEQKARIGRLRIRANVEGALIQLDGVDIGQNSIEELPIAVGEHIVSTVASGYIPRRMRVIVMSQTAQEVNFTLQPLETTLAHLVVTADVPDVEVIVDGEIVGRTPFPASLAFSPGTHAVILRRSGYIEEKRSIVLDPGGEGHLEFEMRPDVVALDKEHGVLDLRISEPNSLVTVNGKPLGVGKSRFELPRGRHRLQVHSAGFLDYTRDVVVAAKGTTARIELMPTSEFLNEYQSGAASQRTWGWISAGAGVAVLGGGVGFLIWNQGEKDAAREKYYQFASGLQDSESGACLTDTCVARFKLFSDKKEEAEGRDVYGWVGVGVGAAAAALGAGLLIWGDDPDRYGPREDSDVFGSIRVDVGLGQTTLSGRF